MEPTLMVIIGLALMLIPMTITLILVPPIETVMDIITPIIIPKAILLIGILLLIMIVVGIVKILGQTPIQGVLPTTVIN